MNTVQKGLPINSMALGKKLARFSFQWSAIGIFIYLMDPESSNTFGRSAVTFRMYCEQNNFPHNACIDTLFLKNQMRVIRLSLTHII